MAELEAVRVRDCACPDTPHEEGDIVFVLPKPSIECGAAAEIAMLESADQPHPETWLLARWTDTFVRYGAVGWNWLRYDDKARHEPVPFDVEVLLADYGIGRLVAVKANELYQAVFLGPLLEAAEAANPAPNRQQRRSQRGRTAASTSPSKAPRTKPSGSSSPPDTDGPLLQAVR